MKKDWTYKKLGEVAEIEYGTRVVQKKDGGSIYPVYGGGGATFKMDTYNREDRLVVARFAMSPKCTRFVTGKFFLNDSGLTLKAGDCLLTPYLNWHVIYHNDNIYRLSKGAAQKNLDVKAFLNLPIHFPPISIQESIVRELDAIHSILEKKQEQLRELDNLAQAIFYDMFGDPLDNDMNWDICKLGDLSIKIANGYNAKLEKDTYKTEGVPYFRCQNIWWNRIDFDDIVYIDDSTNEKMKASSLMKNDLIISKIGRVYTENSSLGRTAMYEGEDRKANISGNLCFVRLNNTVVPRFILHILTLEKYRKWAMKNTPGGIDKRAMSVGQISGFPIILPPLSLQQSFAAKIEAIEAQKQAVQQSIREVEALLAERMDYYFS